MKTILITSFSPKITRYFFRSGLLELITQKRDSHVVLVVPVGEEDEYRNEFGSEHIEVAGMQLPPISWLQRFYIFLSTAAFGIKFTRFYHRWEHYWLGSPWIKVYIKRLLARLFGRSRAFQALVRTAYAAWPTPAALNKVFDDYRPDLVFATQLINVAWDVPMIVAAQRRGIRTAGAVCSWDNLTGYGFLLCHPDFLVLQNEYLKEAATTNHFVPPERIHITGFTHFDWYARRELLLSREEFLRSLGVDPGKRVILYGSSGESHVQHRIETSFVEIFEELKAAGRIPADLVMIFRAHPLFQYPLEQLSVFPNVVPDKVLGHGFQTVGRPEIDRRDMIHLYNSLVHSDIIMVPAGTIAIEAITLDRPVITLAFDGKERPRYWNSLARPYDSFDYWMDLMRWGGLRKVESADDLARAINEYLEDPSRDGAGRARVRERFAAGAVDGRMASERLANVLRHLLFSTASCV